MRVIALLVIAFLAGGVIMNKVKLTDTEMTAFVRATLSAITGAPLHTCEKINEADK